MATCTGRGRQPIAIAGAALAALDPLAVAASAVVTIGERDVATGPAVDAVALAVDAREAVVAGSAGE
jgi:hypothetical protein